MIIAKTHVVGKIEHTTAIVNQTFCFEYNKNNMISLICPNISDKGLRFKTYCLVLHAACENCRRKKWLKITRFYEKFNYKRELDLLCDCSLNKTGTVNFKTIYLCYTPKKHAKLFLLDRRIFPQKKIWVWVLYSSSQRGEHEKQIVFDTMYRSLWPLFKVLNPAFSFVNDIQNVRRPTWYYVVLRRPRDKTL